jgi:hypothetical protein
MKKIVIALKGPEFDSGLIELVRNLFPESEVCIVPSLAENMGMILPDRSRGICSPERSRKCRD